MSAQSPSKFRQSIPEWIPARAIVRSHAEAAWEEMLCEFSGSEIIYTPENVVAFEGLETGDIVALHLFDGIDFYDEGSALMQQLFDFSVVQQIRALLGVNVKVDCLIVANLEIESLATFERIMNYTEFNPSDFYQTLRRCK